MADNSLEPYFAKDRPFQSEVLKLREILLSTGLLETKKWGAPHYTLDGKNIVAIAAFKSYFGLWFHQGALLKDERGLLTSAQDGVTKAQRVWRMTSSKDIKPTIIKAYVKEASANQAEGKSVKPDRNKALIIPDELKEALKANKSAAKSFDAMGIGKRREYADHIAMAKQGATKQRRLEKILPLITEGKGLHDKYRR